MKLKPADLDLTARKALVGRILRAQAEVGALGEQEFLILQGRIEQAKDRKQLDAIQAEVEQIACGERAS